MPENLPAIQQTPSGIKGDLVNRRPVVAGYVKWGGKKPPQKKGTKEFRRPYQLGHFKIVTLERDENGDFIEDTFTTEKIRDKCLYNGPYLVGIPIRLPFDDPLKNFPTRLVAFGRNSKDRVAQLCSGNGEEAIVTETKKPVKCPCDWYHDPKGPCKKNGVLHFTIEGAGMYGALWQARTTSGNTIGAIESSLLRFQKDTITPKFPNGCLSWLPLGLIIVPKTTTTPDGATTKIWVVSIISNLDREDIYRRLIEVAKVREQLQIGMAKIDDDVYVTAEAKDSEMGEDAIASEWYPAQAGEHKKLDIVEEGAVAEEDLILEKPKAQVMRQRTLEIIPAKDGKKAIMTAGITLETIKGIRRFKAEHGDSANGIVTAHLQALNLSSTPGDQDFTEVEGLACLAELNAAFEQPQEPEHVDAEIIPPADDFVDQVHCPNAACMIPRANCGPCPNRKGCPEVPQEPLDDEEPPF